MTDKRLLMAPIFLLAGVLSPDQVSGSEVRIRCIDAELAEVIACSISRLPSEAIGASDARGFVTIDLVGPDVNLQLSSTSGDYSPRKVWMIAGLQSDGHEAVREIALARRLPVGTSANIGSVNRVRSLVEAGRLDQALAMMEETDRSAPAGVRSGTFFVRLTYWRMVVSFRACTRLNYGVCDRAKNLAEDLGRAIRSNPADFDRERVNLNELDDVFRQIEISEFNHQVARAEWFKRVGEFEKARELFIGIKADVESRSNEFLASVRYSGEVVQRELAHIDTLERSRGLGSATANAGPLTKD